MQQNWKKNIRMIKRRENSNYENQKWGEITIYLTEKKRLWEYYEQLCSNKLNNPYEMQNLIESHKLRKLTQEPK